MLPGVFRVLSPAAPSGCCHLVFVGPYDSLLFHLSLFCVMALFRTAVVFLTLDRIPLLRGKHEDDRDSLCIVPEFKGAAASNLTDHSSLLSSSSSSPSEEEGVKISLTLHSFISLLTLHFLCIRCGIRCALFTEWFHNSLHDSTVDVLVILFDFQITSQNSTFNS